MSKYKLGITTNNGIVSTEVDINRCLSDVGVNGSILHSMSSYVGNISQMYQKDDRFFFTGSAGFIGYDARGNEIVEIRNQVTFDKIGPPQIACFPQIATQVVTINKKTGQKHPYFPPNQHFLTATSGTITISNLEGIPFVSADFYNPHVA